MKELQGENIVVYDTEIKNVIDGKNVTWSTYDKMGISVACAFDYREMRYRVFCDDNIQDLADRLNEFGTLIVAFNQKGFDNNLMRAFTTLNPDSELWLYDMLEESRIACGADKFTKGFRLQNHLETMKLDLKTADGAMAPIWWQEGKVGRVIDYCLNDVRVEKGLFEHIVEFGWLACAHRSLPYPVRNPFL